MKAGAVNLWNARRLSVVAAAVVMALAACGGEGTAEPGAAGQASTSVPTTTLASTTIVAPTTVAPTTTTTLLPTTTTTIAPTALEALGYPVSDDYIVETIVRGLDSATGGLAIDPDGVMYQADFGYSGHPGDSVYKIFPDGTIETLVQSDDMASLTMTTFGPDGTLYQSSYGSDTVFKIAPDGSYGVVATKLKGPTGIVALEDGTLFVEAYDSNTIHKIHPDGTVEDWVFDRRFNGINGLTSAPEGTLYVIDHKDGSLFSVDQEGTVEKIHKFPEATSHGVYSDGSIFITSRNGYVVFRYEIATGFAEIIAGNGEPGDKDGRGGEASFGRPNAITIGPDGSFYTNHGEGRSNDPVSIRRITYSP